MSAAYTAARASLRKKLGDIDNQIGRVVAEMADHYVGPDIRVWPVIRPVFIEGTRICRGWTATVNARIPGYDPIVMPVIPDEFNPRPGKVIKAEDQPHEFRAMEHAERAAEDAVTAMRQQLKKMMGGA